MITTALDQTLIGAAAAIVGGLGAALWQTARADNVAQRIRRAERYETALLDLNATVTVSYERLLALFRRVERGQTPAQFNEARQELESLRLHWESQAKGVIGNQAIVTAYAYFNAAVHDGLPAGIQLQRVQELASGDQEAGRRFVRDLGTVVGRLDELKKALEAEVKSLDRQPARRTGRKRRPGITS